MTVAAIVAGLAAHAMLTLICVWMLVLRYRSTSDEIVRLTRCLTIATVLSLVQFMAAAVGAIVTRPPAQALFHITMLTGSMVIFMFGFQRAAYPRNPVLRRYAVSNISTRFIGTAWMHPWLMLLAWENCC
jgi:hypothetical protein